MKTIRIYHLWTDYSNYLVEIDSISHHRGEILLIGYIIDSSNPYIPIGEEFCFSIEKSPSYNLLKESGWYSDYNMELIDTIYFPNWFERLLGKR